MIPKIFAQVLGNYSIIRHIPQKRQYTINPASIVNGRIVIIAKSEIVNAVTPSVRTTLIGILSKFHRAHPGEQSSQSQ